jgi:uncharacterized protein VirK/YbjX
MIHRGPKLSTLSKLVKHCARGVIFAPYTHAWFKILQQPELAVVIHDHPDLYQKLQRPYLYRTLNTPQRLAAVREHYRFVVEHFSPACRQEIYTPPGKTLAQLPLAELGNFGLCVTDSRMEKEGDLILCLRNQANQEVLCTLAFSITQFAPEKRELFIGGLQGNKYTHDKEEVIAITRGLHGLRPKALLLFALQSLGTIWGVTRLRAVSDAMHIYQHWQKKRTVASSYDEWWLESGGQLAADGLFDLPVTFVPRDITLLKANKRPVYRRRYQMQEDIARQIAAAGI